MQQFIFWNIFLYFPVVFGHLGNTSQLFLKPFQAIEATSRLAFSQIAQQLSQVAVELEPSSSSSQLCYKSIVNILESGYTRKWSAQFINANALNSPLLVGHLLSQSYTNLGDFDDCLPLSHIRLALQNDSAKSLLYKGKYCLVQATVENFNMDPENASESYLESVAYRWTQMRNRIGLVNGICIPSICSAAQVERLIEKYFRPYLVGLNITVGHCQVVRSFEAKAEEGRPDFAYNLARNLLKGLLLLSLTCTFLPALLRLPKSLLPLLKCFHLGANCHALFRLPRPQSPRPLYDLRFIHGGRALLVIFTVTSHSFVYIPATFFSRVSHFMKGSSFFEESQTNWGLLESINERGGFLMDDFALISGFLVTYIVLSQLKRPPNFLLYAALRWIRLAPSIAVLICLSLVAHRDASGPLAHPAITGPHVAHCGTNWWTHLLLVNNFWTMDEMCGPHLWFVASDFQLHLLFYPILVLLFYKPIAAYISTAVLILGTSIGLFAIGWFELAGVPDFGFTYKFENPIPYNSIRILYTSPLVRIVPYLFGVLIAVYLLKSKKVPAKSKHQDLIFWLNILLIAFCILSPKPEAVKNNPRLDALYFLFLQFVHSLLACHLFYGLLTKAESSFKALFYAPYYVPLSRLSYSMYLLNPLLIWYNLAHLRQPLYLTPLGQIQFMTTIYLQSMIAAIGLYVFCEAPFGNLSKLFISWLAGRENMNNKKE